jgi:signal transduction histidine kinase
MKEITSPTEPENQLTDIYALLDQAIVLVQVPKNIELVKNYVDGFLAVSLDEEKIKRVFYNILRNSIEAMNLGGTITVSIDKGMVLFVFKDDGVGIPESIIQDIYTPFYTTKPNSLGLGLSFCKLAVESN